MSADSALSIGALARATGVPVNTLRTWERRYGFPHAERLPSGHRRYGREQVQHIQWIHRAIRLGYKPSTLGALSTDALQSLVQTKQRTTPAHYPSTPSALETWLQHVDQLDMTALEAALLKGWNQYGAIGLLDDYVRPFLVEVGLGWRAGRFTIAQEHVATECVSAFLAARWRPLVTQASEPAVVLATLPGEEHVLGIHQVALVLAMHGYRVHFLGRGAPVPALVAAVHQLKPMAFMVGKKLVYQGKDVDVEALKDPSTELKSLV